MSTLKIKKVNALPAQFTSNTLYLLKIAGVSKCEVYLSSSDGSTVTQLSVPAAAETDPVFVASPAAGITTTQVSNWDAAHASLGDIASALATINGV